MDIEAFKTAIKLLEAKDPTIEFIMNALGVAYDHGINMQIKRSKHGFRIELSQVDYSILETELLALMEEIEAEIVYFVKKEQAVIEVIDTNDRMIVINI